VTYLDGSSALLDLWSTGLLQCWDFGWALSWDFGCGTGNCMNGICAKSTFRLGSLRCLGLRLVPKFPCSFLSFKIVGTS
jgi:hypothetical protein